MTTPASILHNLEGISVVKDILH